MRSTAFWLLLPSLLGACASTNRSRDRTADSPPEATAAVAAPLEGPSESEARATRSYRSSVSVCYDAALRLCRDRDARVLRQERGAAEGSSISARSGGFEFALGFAQTPEGTTRVMARVRGNATRENLEEATRVLNQLSDLLLEPRE